MSDKITFTVQVSSNGERVGMPRRQASCCVSIPVPSHLEGDQVLINAFIDGYLEGRING